MRIGDRMYYEDGATGILVAIVRGDDELEQVADDDKSVVLVVQRDDGSGFECLPLFPTEGHDAAQVQKMRWQ